MRGNDKPKTVADDWCCKFCKHTTRRGCVVQHQNKGGLAKCSKCGKDKGIVHAKKLPSAMAGTRGGPVSYPTGAGKAKDKDKLDELVKLRAKVARLEAQGNSESDTVGNLDEITPELEEVYTMQATVNSLEKQFASKPNPWLKDHIHSFKAELARKKKVLDSQKHPAKITKELAGKILAQEKKIEKNRTELIEAHDAIITWEKELVERQARAKELKKDLEELRLQHQQHELQQREASAPTMPPDLQATLAQAQSVFTMLLAAAQNISADPGVSEETKRQAEAIQPLQDTIKELVKRCTPCSPVEPPAVPPPSLDAMRAPQQQQQQEQQQPAAAAFETAADESMLSEKDTEAKRSWTDNDLMQARAPKLQRHK